VPADEGRRRGLGGVLQSAAAWRAGRGRQGPARLSMTPLPIMVSQNGMPISSTNFRSMLDVSLRFAPAPMTSSGWEHACRAADSGSELPKPQGT